MLEDVVDGVVDAVPLGEELGEDGFAFGGEPVEALVALVFFAPLAGEEALGFEAAEEGVEGAFLDGEAFVGEGFAEGVAVVLGRSWARTATIRQPRRSSRRRESKIWESESGWKWYPYCMSTTV